MKHKILLSFLLTLLPFLLFADGGSGSYIIKGKVYGLGRDNQKIILQNTPFTIQNGMNKDKKFITDSLGNYQVKIEWETPCRPLNLEEIKTDTGTVFKYIHDTAADVLDLEWNPEVIIMQNSYGIGELGIKLWEISFTNIWKEEISKSKMVDGEYIADTVHTDLVARYVPGYDGSYVIETPLNINITLPHEPNWQTGTPSEFIVSKNNLNINEFKGTTWYFGKSIKGKYSKLQLHTNKTYTLYDAPKNVTTKGNWQLKFNVDNKNRKEPMQYNKRLILHHTATNKKSILLIMNFYDNKFTILHTDKTIRYYAKSPQLMTDILNDLKLKKNNEK